MIRMSLHKRLCIQADIMPQAYARCASWYLCILVATRSFTASRCERTCLLHGVSRNRLLRPGIWSKATYVKEVSLSDWTLQLVNGDFSGGHQWFDLQVTRLWFYIFMYASRRSLTWNTVGSFGMTNSRHWEYNENTMSSNHLGNYYTIIWSCILDTDLWSYDASVLSQGERL